MRVYDPGQASNLLGWLKRAFRGLGTAQQLAQDDELARRLAETGLTRADLQSGAKVGPKQRRRMAGMMRHFGIDPDTTKPRHWGALREAQRVCVQCRTEGRCHRWLTWGRANDAPRVFCPNAALFDEIAYDARDKDAS